MSKKILSVMLALVFVVSAFTVSAFAVGGTAVDPEAATKTQAWALSDPTGDGPYSVDVTLDANYKVGAIQFKVVGADAVLTGVALNADVFGADWEDNYDVDFTDDGLVIIIPTPGSAAKQGPDLTGGKKIVTLTYELAEGKTSATIAIENDPKAENNIGGSLIAVRMSDDSLTTGTLYFGQTVLSVGEAKTLGSAADIDLALTDTGATDGVIIDRNKTFGGAYAGVVYGFKWSADNTFRSKDYLVNSLTSTRGQSEDLVIKTSDNKATGLKWGTGSTVEVSGKIYVVVIFGDVNCDGFINNNDVATVKAHVKKVTYVTENTPAFLAANAHYQTASMAKLINNNDLSAVKQHQLKSKRIDQAAAATKHASFTSNYI